MRLFFCCLIILLAGCNGNSTDNALERARAEGRLVLAYANEEPYGYLDTEHDRVTGEAPEIARIIAKRLGINEVEMQMVEWKSLIPGLKAGRFDLIGAGMYITPERAANVAFTNPSYRIGEAFLVQAGNPKQLDSYAAITTSKAVLGVVKGTVERRYARELSIPDEQVKVFNDNDSAVAAVRSGQIDAFAGTALTIQTLVSKLGADVQRADPFEQPVINGKTVYGYGAFAFHLDNTELRDAFNAELATFIGSDEHLELVAPFGFTAAELPGQVSAAELSVSTATE
ncbi:MAG: ectoine/hydroxyectoine ABC transporter substrate-binding protein EhuB [Planctomycetota bacterium]|jgi:polar amino acid transport system substrate-binding protein|nr:ectoine/hydroxyectoine ABC transporter substrate-binding protein EhuB [Planctomycetota bacterium]